MKVMLLSRPLRKVTPRVRATESARWAALTAAAFGPAVPMRTAPASSLPQAGRQSRAISEPIEWPMRK